MSENLDLVRSIFSGWERGDFSAADWADPQIEYSVTGGLAEGERSTGVAGMARGFRSFLSAWDGYRVAADEYRELDPERVIVFAHASGGRAKTSGLELGQVGTEGAVLFHVRNGRVTRLVLFPVRDRALADLGLEE
jgi:ketosteroid isomerase-like protein